MSVGYIGGAALSRMQWKRGVTENVSALTKKVEVVGWLSGGRVLNLAFRAVAGDVEVPH